MGLRLLQSSVWPPTPLRLQTSHLAELLYLTAGITPPIWRVAGTNNHQGFVPAPKFFHWVMEMCRHVSDQTARYRGSPWVSGESLTERRASRENRALIVEGNKWRQRNKKGLSSEHLSRKRSASCLTLHRKRPVCVKRMSRKGEVGAETSPRLVPCTPVGPLPPISPCQGLKFKCPLKLPGAVGVGLDLGTPQFLAATSLEGKEESTNEDGVGAVRTGQRRQQLSCPPLVSAGPAGVAHLPLC